MATKIRINTKTQNIVLGVIVGIFSLVLGIMAILEFSSNTEKITNREIVNLSKRVEETEQSINRYLSTLYESLGEIFYDDRVKKASLTTQTRLFPVYQAKAHEALREFALFKELKNIFLFDESFNIVTSVNRSVFLTEQNLDDIKNRLENYKEKQVILQTIGQKKVALLVFRLDFSELNSAYIVVIKDLEELTAGLSDYETEKAEYFLFTRTLGYKNSLIKLKKIDSADHYALQEDTLMRFNVGFVRSFNAEGEETFAKVKDLDDYQHSFILGMLKPDYLAEKIHESEARISSYYTFWFLWLLLTMIVYGALLLSKANIQDTVIFVKNKMVNKIKGEDFDLRPQELSKQAKRQAYSYIEEENTLKNSVFKVYNSLRKMSPEDIRNLSIKNSLSKENIRLVYQPVVDSRTMQPQFCEVFLRLLNYYGEELMPSEFIPVLQHFNMLENLDEMMLEKVTRKVQSLQSTDSAARISLNISKGAFNSEMFLRKLKANLIKGNINTDNVMLEIPDLEIMEDEGHSAFIKDLRGYGVHFAVSIDVLDSQTVKVVNEHNIQYVRIDMSRFSDVLENTEKQNILKQIIANANKNGLNLIAERIETEFMFKLAKSLGIQLLQGYYIGKPKKYYTHK